MVALIKLAANFSAGIVRHEIRGLPAMKKLKFAFTVFAQLFLLFVIFFFVFPIVHKVETLDPATVKTDGKFMDIGDGITIHYREYGAGEPLLLIHGFTSSSYTWTDVAPELSKKYRVIAPDLPGFGLTSKPKDAPYNYKAFSEALIKLMDKLGVQKASVAGNSMGGGTALQLTLDHPDRVDKLILIDSAGVAHGDKDIMFRLMATPGINSFMSACNNPTFTALNLKKMAFYDDSKVTREKAEAYFLPFRTKGALNAAARTMNENDLAGPEPRLGEIKKETLIIWGDKDALIYPPVAYKFEKSIKGSRLEILEKCGHMPQEERPEETAAIMMRFLAGDEKQ